jgi:hypothetical protein
MTTAIIACLAIVALYLAKKWSDAHAQVGELRNQVALLKRQLAKRPRP